MLPRRLRVSRRAFPSAARGARLSGQYLTLVYGPSREGGCAAVVSKKVAKRSVDRHLLKRRILSVLRPYCSPSRFLVVYAKMGSHRAPFRELSAELSALLARSTRPS